MADAARGIIPPGSYVEGGAGTNEDVWTNWTDITDPFPGVTSLAFGNEPNDGLVGECSTKMGNVIGTHYDMNHVDAINHLFGARSWRTNPVSLYRSQANRLKNRGLLLPSFPRLDSSPGSCGTGAGQ
ncbi:hypothetical protein NLU14_04000 [Marinobacter sp. 71-i]|uniref:Uncharacterized protein n=1 Tax=Marinobacter iranensis TaxID=2962607 RepID=A0ABT5Y738_9GAMM|nr:hypothetical protein [Marinobacter iranensis]MDF0749389.1 hypothetical protein [Marinobacter iranensis]